MKTTTLFANYIQRSLTPSALLLLSLLIGCFGLLSKAKAVTPAPDGGYAGGNTAEGQNALLSLTTGTYNTAIGLFSLLSLTDGSFCTGLGAGTLLANTGGENTAIGAGALLSNTTGINNTANGAFALFSNTNGVSNTATGSGALLNNTTGNLNAALGASTLQHNTTGEDNIAVGAFALFSNTEGGANTALGRDAMEANTTGENNTAVGWFALASNTAANQNTAVGYQALNQNTTGYGNTAIGAQALLNNIGGDIISGNSNTAVGASALRSNTSGTFNTAHGDSALLSNIGGGGNNAFGHRALFSNESGSFNTAIGDDAGFNITGSGNICIGRSVAGVASENNTIRIGDNLPTTAGDAACYIGGIYNQLGDPSTITIVGIDANGKLATSGSSRRFKHDIKPMDKSSEAILALNPVTFHYRSDPKSTPCFGLIAEEVAAVNPDLVVRNEKGEIWTVRYEQVNAMLLNEFLKEHRKVQALEKGMTVLDAELKEQAAQLQKVSAQIELNRQAPQQVVSENSMTR